MRTTITLAEELLAKAQKITGRSGYSEAIVTSLKDYIATKERLNYLAMLYSQKMPHVFSKIKKRRRQGRWSS